MHRSKQDVPLLVHHVEAGIGNGLQGPQRPNAPAAGPESRSKVRALTRLAQDNRDSLEQ